jgi:hypothetical protein
MYEAQLLVMAVAGWPRRAAAVLLGVHLRARVLRS